MIILICAIKIDMNAAFTHDPKIVALSELLTTELTKSKFPYPNDKQLHNIYI
jgi:hypothetical protein